MKQLTTMLLFSAISFFTFAQTPFTEKMLNDHAQRLVANPIKWMKEDVSPNFVLSGSEGIAYSYLQTMALFEGVNVLSRELADVKISLYGNVAVATGIVTAKNTIKANGMPLNHHERFTYVLQNQKEKWILMSGQHTTIQPPASEDNPEEIVKQWISEYNKDNKSFFVNNCTEDFIASNSGINGGKFFGREFIEKRAEGVTSDVETTNMKSFKSGNLAVVIGNLIWHHKQPDGSDKTDKTVSTFVMQKKDDKWRYAGHHISSMVEEKPEDVLKQFVTEYNKDATGFFMDRCSDNFRYTDGEGKFSGKDALKSDKTHTSDSEVSDMKVLQSGNLAVVSGIHIWKDATMKVVRKVAFTYTLQKMNGKWQFAASHHTPVKE